MSNEFWICLSVSLSGWIFGFVMGNRLVKLARKYAALCAKHGISQEQCEKDVL